jgi:hypothetical protein
MPKCLDCGNTRVFHVEYSHWDRVFYYENGEYQDSKNIDVETTETPPSCGECHSVNCEGDF